MGTLLSRFSNTPDPISEILDSEVPPELLIQAIHSLVENGKYKPNSTYLHDRTLLSLCASLGYLDTCKLLVNHNADVNIQDPLGRTALYFAASRDHSQVVDFLCESGANPNTAPYLPLHQAIRHQSHVIVEILLKYKANPLLIDRDNLTAFEQSIVSCNAASFTYFAETIGFQSVKRSVLVKLFRKSNPAFHLLFLRYLNGSIPYLGSLIQECADVGRISTLSLYLPL